MSSCFGSIQTGSPRFGECCYCWDENFDRKNSFYFEQRQRMIGPVCGHRLLSPKRTVKQFKYNLQTQELRQKKPDEGYWYKRAHLPEYYGEFGELSDPHLAGLNRMEDEEAEEAIKRSRIAHVISPVEVVAP